VRRFVFMLAALAGAAVLAAPALATSDSLVSVGSPTDLHPQNAQNEPSLAVDASRPTILAAGANDLVDMQPCSQAAATTAGACSFPLGTFNLGVGLSAAYFSFDSGHTWVQPTYQGLTAADCSPTVEPCIPHPGPIHTVPNFYEAGLRSRSDTGVAFGPRPVNGHFSWGNGSRLYFSSLATNLTETKIGSGNNSTFAVTVSFIDNVTPERIQDQENWSRPYFVAEHAATSAGLDKEQIWADNASSSAFFGNVYVCYVDFHSFSGGNSYPLVPIVAASSDGGTTWKNRKIAPPVANAQHGAYDGCTVRTDSHGVVYAFFTHFGGSSLVGAHALVKSYDGGATWTKPRDVVPITDPCYFVDPVVNRCMLDGPAGARTDLSAMPSVDIANGAPSGADATDEIIDAWSDGAFGLQLPTSMVSYSTDQGTTWSEPAVASGANDRSIYSAPAISPDGTSVYLVYMAFQTPFQETTASPRLLHGVLRQASIGTDGAPGAWTTVYTGPLGDARGTSQGRILYNEFLGDYVYAIATTTYGTGVWTDVRDAADCPAMDDWRQRSYEAGRRVFPAPWPIGDCTGSFGNNDIWAATTG
jgi:hypothetical protein